MKVALRAHSRIDRQRQTARSEKLQICYAGEWHGHPEVPPLAWNVLAPFASRSVLPGRIWGQTHSLLNFRPELSEAYFI